MLLEHIALMGWLHTIACVIALVAGAYVLIARKGTRRHRQWGWWYAGSTAVQCISIMAVYHFDIVFGKQTRTGPGLFGIFHWMAVITFAAVALAVFAASRQRKAVWAHTHAQAMLFSYYMLIGGLINELFVRVTVLRNLALYYTPDAGNPANTMMVRLFQTGGMMIWLALALWFAIKVMRDRKPRPVTNGYPLRFSGGAFVGCMGLGIIAGTLLGNIGFGLIGGAIAGGSLSGKVRRMAQPRHGNASLNQLRVMIFAIGLEMLVFSLMGASGLFASLPPAELWDICFGIVGAHFLIMRFSHGPMMLRLAGAVLGWLALGIALHVSPSVLALGDGAIKLGMGLWMLWPLFKQETPASPGYRPESSPAPASPAE